MSTNELSSHENDHTDPTQEPYAPRKLWSPVKDTVSHEETPTTSEDTVAEPAQDAPAQEVDATSAHGVESAEAHEPALDLPDSLELPEVMVGEEFVLAPEDAELTVSHEDPSGIVGELPTETAPSPEPAPLPDTVAVAPATPATDSEDAAVEDAAQELSPDTLDEDSAADQDETEPTADVAVSHEEAGANLVAHEDPQAELAQDSDGDAGEDTLVEEISAPDDVHEDEEAADPEQPHTTTIPVADTDADDEFDADSILPADVLEARDPENPSTTAIRRDLMSPIEEEEDVQTTSNWESVAEHSRSARRGEPVRTPLTGETPESLDDVIFEGATVVPVVPSRTSSHLLSLGVGLVFIPIAWYLFADAGARMIFPENAPIVTGALDTTAIIEFAGALAAMAVFLFALMRSSLGAWVWGVVLTLIGLPWLIVPGIMKQHTSSFFAWLDTQGPIGSNLAHHIQTDAYSGRFLFIGVVLLALAIVAVAVRRRGRAEEALRARVEKVNPGGAYLNARERRRAAKEARRSAQKK